MNKPDRLSKCRDLARTGNCRIVEKNGVYTIFRKTEDRAIFIAKCGSIQLLETTIRRVIEANSDSPNPRRFV